MNGNGWQKWALGALLGLLLGGVGSALYGNAQAKAVETRLDAKIEKLEYANEKNFEIILKMSDTLARMETKIEYIQDRVED